MIPLSDEETRPNRVPILTYLLIAANVAAFFLATDMDIYNYALEAGDIMAGQDLITLFTSMFLHGGFLHLLFNVWSLWIFGDNVEDDLGFLGYILLYLASGVAGGLAFAFLAGSYQTVIGASGAISGVMGAYLILHPRNRVLTLVPLGFWITTLRINAPIFIGIWFLIQFAGLAGSSQDGIAYSAHVGGFLAGLGLAKLLSRKNHPGQA